MQPTNGWSKSGQNLAKNMDIHHNFDGNWPSLNPLSLTTFPACRRHVSKVRCPSCSSPDLHRRSEATEWVAVSKFLNEFMLAPKFRPLSWRLWRLTRTKMYSLSVKVWWQKMGLTRHKWEQICQGRLWGKTGWDELWSALLARGRGAGLERGCKTQGCTTHSRHSLTRSLTDTS